jgi:hypothetical protein
MGGSVRHSDAYCRSTCAGTHGVTGRFLFRTFGLLAAYLYANKRYAHLFCSSRSPNTEVSDAEKRVVNCAVARSVDAVPESPLIPPCLFAMVQLCRELGGLEKKLRWQRLRLQPRKVNLRYE